MNKQTTTDIHADVDTVWRHLTTPELMGAWMTSAANLRTKDGGSLSAMNPVMFDARGKTYETVVTRFQAPIELELESNQGPFTARYRYQLESAGHKTRLVITITFAANGLARLIKPMVAAAVWKTDQDQGGRIAAAVHGASTDG